MKGMTSNQAAQYFAVDVQEATPLVVVELVTAALRGEPALTRLLLYARVNPHIRPEAGARACPPSHARRSLDCRIEFGRRRIVDAVCDALLAQAAGKVVRLADKRKSRREGHPGGKVRR